MSRYLTELIGTFFLVLTIGLTVIGGSATVIPPLAVGAALIALVFAGGHVSGAHYNPAMTVAIFLRGRFEARDVVPYWAAQLAGALAAAATVGYLRAGVAIVRITPSPGPTFVAELLFTFALAHVILYVATSKGTAGNTFYGLAIGLIVMAGAFAVGNISGAAFNPAVAVAACVMGLIAWPSLGIYLAANFAGAALAAGVFRWLNPDDR